MTFPTRAGYTFSHYYGDGTSGGNANEQYSMTTSGVTATDLYIDIYKDATLYAKWTPNTYTVTLNNNGGSGGTASVSATYGSAMPTVSTLPTRSGFVFGGYLTGASPSFTTPTYNVEACGNQTWRIGVGVSSGYGSTTLQQGMLVKFTLSYTSTSSTVTSIDINDAGYANNITIDNTNKMIYGLVTITSGNYIGTYSFIDVNVSSTSDTVVRVHDLQICSTTNLQYYNLKGTSQKSYMLTSGTTLYACWISGLKTITISLGSTIGGLSNIRYSTSDGHSGSLSSSNSSVSVTMLASGTVTISATVKGTVTMTSVDGSQIVTRYGLSVNNSVTYNISSTPQTKSKDVYVSGVSAIIVEGKSSNLTPSLCCVDGDSEIAMADGTTKAIKDIEIGDKILSYDEDSKILSETTVEKLIVKTRQEMLYITFADGTILKITPDHPMFSERGWVVHDIENGKIAYPDVDIQDEIVKNGDMLLSLSLMFDKEIVDIKIVEEQATVYTLTVADNHNFFAQGVLVHNAADPCITPKPL